MREKKTYNIKEIFFSPQGEGHRVGSMNVFVRFAGCNLQCTVDKEGFNCDTDFFKGTKMSIEEIEKEVKRVGRTCTNIIYTGGEPALQLDEYLINSFRREGYYQAIETNGTKNLPKGLNYIACSPKPGSKPVIVWADEVRCVIKPGMFPDAQGIVSNMRFVSPAAYAPTADTIKRGWKAKPEDLLAESIAWAVKWCEDHPTWRISIQTHKVLQVR